MIFKDYYKILGLENSKATITQIKTAYREQAKKHHPDVNVGNSFAEERFKDINEAYKVLSDSSAKRKYDRMWNNHVAKKNIKYEENKLKGNAVNEFLGMFFGNASGIQEHNQEKTNNKKIPVKGENIETSIDISIQDAFYGVNKNINLRTIDGKMKKFDVKIPEGIRNNEKIRLVGQGKTGINGGSNGDLFINVNIQDDSKFKIKGYNLYTDLYLTPWEAVLGTKANIVGIDDESSIQIPSGTQSGEKITIPGKGYKNALGERGDLIANIRVMVPKRLSEEEKEIYTRLKEISSFNPRIIYN